MYGRWTLDHTEAMGKPWRNPQLPMTTRVQLNANPLPICGGIVSDIDGHIKNRSRKNGDQFALWFFTLKVKPPKHTFSGH